MNPFPAWLEKIWDVWDVRVMVLGSLMLQIILIFLGGRRKYIRGIWIDVIVWPSYLMADWVAAVALGKLADASGDTSSALLSLWAPLLLLHLGGPDTIIALSVEDITLWLRHALGLVVQVALAIYVFLRFWTGSINLLFILNFLMFIAGILKYSERSWALFSANSTFPQPNLPIRYSNYYRWKDIVDTIGGEPSAKLISMSYIWLRDLSAPVFASRRHFQTHRGNLTREMYEEEKSGTLFKLVEIALGFTYDVLYTKATRIYTLTGGIFRLISFVCIVSVLGGFSILAKHRYSKVDVCITYILLVGAVVLELYGFTLMIFSDWAMVLLAQSSPIDPLLIRIKRFLGPPVLNNLKRWSSSMAQLELVGLIYEEEKSTTIAHGILKLFGLGESFIEYRCRKYENNLEGLKEVIFKWIQKTVTQLDSKKPFTQRGELALVELGEKGSSVDTVLENSIRREYDESIIIWHLATEYCCTEDTEDPRRKSCKLMSDYMMYILANHPSLLGNVTSRRLKLVFEDWRKICRSEGLHKKGKADRCKALLKLLDARHYVDGLTEEENKKLANCTDFLRGEHLDKIMLDEYLREFRKQKRHPDETTAGEPELYIESLAETLMNEYKDEKWEIISNVWAEMLCHGAANGKVNIHLDQLRRGGEFLTHVWLLLTVHGLTDTDRMIGGEMRSSSRNAIQNRIRDIPASWSDDV